MEPQCIGIFNISSYNFKLVFLKKNINRVIINLNDRFVRMAKIRNCESYVNFDFQKLTP